MQELRFQIQGSAADPYDIRIVRRDDGNVSAYCTCPAAENGQHCKHRIGLLTGEPEGIIGNRASDIKAVISWVQGSDIETALQELRNAEEQLESLKSKVSRLKKSLAKSMLD